MEIFVYYFVQNWAITMWNNLRTSLLITLLNTALEQTPYFKAGILINAAFE